MKAEFVTKKFFVCPSCKEDTGSILYPGIELNKEFGVWYCDSCGAGFKGEYEASVGIWHIEAVEGKKKLNKHDLLVLPPQKHPVFFMLKGYTYTGEWGRVGTQYFYESHSCPSNWLKNVVEVGVVDESGNFFDEDPHGLLLFVKSVDRVGMETPEMLEAFPEIGEKTLEELLESRVTRLRSKAEGKP